MVGKKGYLFSVKYFIKVALNNIFKRICLLSTKIIVYLRENKLS